MATEATRLTIQITLNGAARAVDITARTTALEMLRGPLKLKGSKEGCGIGECGACTIMVDGLAVNACLMPAAQLDGRTVETIEGVGTPDALHPIQQSFVDRHAVQCGFCTPGLVMSTKALLDADPEPDETAIYRAIAGNLCRCTGYHHVLDSVNEAARRCKGEPKP